MTAEDDALLAALYEGPLEDPPWSEFLEALRARLGALTATWIVRAPCDPSLGLVLSRGVRRFESAYRERYFGSDPFVNLPEGEVFALADLVPEATLRASEFFRQLLAPAGVLHVMGVDLTGGGLDARLRISRAQGAPAWLAEERRSLAALVPHARRVLRLYARITQVEGERDAYADTVDQLAVGALLLDERGCVLSQNAASARLARAGAGLGVRDGQPMAATPAETRRLREAIERSLAARASGAPAVVEALRLSSGDGAEFGLLIRPLPRDPAQPGRARPALALFVGDPSSRDEIPIDAVRGLFGLTQAEVESRRAPGRRPDARRSGRSARHRAQHGARPPALDLREGGRDAAGRPRARDPAQRRDARLAARSAERSEAEWAASDHLRGLQRRDLVRAVAELGEDLAIVLADRRRRRS